MIRTTPFPLLSIRTSLILTMMLVVSMTSCQTEEEERLEPVPYQVLETILSTQELNFDEVVESLIANEELITEDMVAPYRQQIRLAGLRARRYKGHAITYHTTDPHGRPVVASGMVYYPQSGTPKGVIEALSFNKEKLKCPTKEPGCGELLSGMAGYIVIVADKLGYGNTESMVIPYMYHENIAKVSADLRVAATELVRNIYGRRMPSPTILGGLSMAASEAWALARHYHLHPELGVRVDHVWMSGGAFRPTQVLEHQLHTQHTDYAFIPNILYSLNHYDNLGLDLQQIFKGELSEHYEEWCTGYVPVLELSERLGSDISQYLNLDFFRDDNPDYQRLLAALAKNDIPNDWVPTCAVHLYHGRDDTFVPVSSSRELADYLKSVGANVEYVETETDHFNCCIAMALDLVTVLYL